MAPGSLRAAGEKLLEDNPKGNEKQWAVEMRRYLDRAEGFFGTDRPLDSIKAKHIREWQHSLEKEGYAPGTVLHHLHALSAVYGYARELELVPSGYNPVSDMYGKPSAQNGRTKSKKAEFMEINEAARFLEVARRVERVPRNGLIPFPYPLVGTFLLTGARKAEVLGLLVKDVGFEAETVSVKPNDWRPLKREWSERTIPLWPQLREILGEYLEMNPPKGALLFPSPRSLHQGREETIWDLRKMLRDISKEAGFSTAPTAKVFRHTYATARLQTTDGGKQISLWTVAKELGHKTVARVEDTYGHPSHFRPRGEVVEYRV